MKFALTLGLPLSLTCIAVMASGCVTSGQYGRVYKELSDTRRSMKAEVTARDELIENLNTSLAATKEHEEELAKDEARLAAEVEHKSAELASLRTQNNVTEKQLGDLSQEKKSLQSKLGLVTAERKQLSERAATMREAMTRLTKHKAKTDEQVRQYRELVEEFAAMIDAGELEVKMTDGRMVLALPSDVLFASGSAELSESGLESITALTKVLRKVGKTKRLQVEGHTDNVPISTPAFPDNWNLASARAMVVLQQMLTAGMDPKRVSAASFGQYRPVNTNKTTQGRAANRRIDIVLVPDLPPIDEAELKRAISKNAGHS